MPSHEIFISVDPPFEPHVHTDSLVALAELVLAAESVGDAELGILVTDDTKICELNRTYADEDKPTDVLSFSLREGEEFVSPDATERLGEVIISYETAQGQAVEAGRAIEDEMAHLLVHGILHLLGYDHAEPDEERVMFGRMEELLGTDRR